MKKNIIAMLGLIMLLTLFGCEYGDVGEVTMELQKISVEEAGDAVITPSESQSPSANAGDENVETSTPNQQLPTDENHMTNDDSYRFDVVLQKSNFEDNNVIEDENAVKWGEEIFIDESATPNLMVSILNDQYELEYVESAYLPLTEYPVHTYKIKGEEYAKIIFSAHTGQIVEYVNIPMKIAYSSEREYIDFIQSLIGNTYDITEFEYNKCSTWHYVFSENAMSSTVEDGFHICSENERWVSYSFYYDKRINGIKTVEHISAEFFEDSFSLEVYDFNYESDEFVRMFHVMDSLTNKISSYLRSNISEKYVVTKIDIKNQEFFIRDGVPYVISNIDMNYSYLASSDEFIQRVNTVSGFFKNVNQ